jgi:hypothetical protein
MAGHFAALQAVVGIRRRKFSNDFKTDCTAETRTFVHFEPVF